MDPVAFLSEEKRKDCVWAYKSYKVSLYVRSVSVGRCLTSLLQKFQQTLRFAGTFEAVLMQLHE